VDCDTHSTVFDFLQPSTTYYWQVHYDINVPQCLRRGRSAVQSFTTSSVIATQPATWGKVKAMYRD
jgi:hypothetical protein